MEGNLSVAKYIWYFVATNVAGLALVALMSAVLALDVGSGPSVAILFVSTLAPLQAFAKDHRREPTKAERTRMVRWSFVAYLILSFAIFAILLALPGPLLPASMPSKVPMGTIALVATISLLIGALLVYGILVLGYKLLSKQALKAVEKQVAAENQESN